MRIKKDDVPIRLKGPGAVARLQTGFGDATMYTMMSAEYFSLAAGTDIAPLLRGLTHDMCHAPHWGYVAEGAMTVRYVDGSIDTIERGDLFHLPPGHTVNVEKDCELLMFSPEHEHIQVLDFMKARMES